MPSKPPTPCCKPGCPELTRGRRYCEAHYKELSQRADKSRPTAHRRGYTGRWRKARTNWLHLHPLCVSHLTRGLEVSANEVDHIVPHRGDMTLFWDTSNWQSLCHVCHSRKTAREDGAWKNVRGGA